MLRQSLNCVCAAVLVLATAAAVGETAKQPDEDRVLSVADKFCETMVVPQDVQGTFTATLKNAGQTGWKTLTGFAGKALRGESKTVDTKGVQQELEEDARLELKRGNWLPMATEVEYGRRSHELLVPTLMDRDGKLGKELYPRAAALLEEIKRGIEGSHDYKFVVFIREEPGFNAMALPGGYLYLDSGLLRDPAQYDKARFALAHEIGHVLQRHETKELQGVIVDSYEDVKELRTAIANSRNKAEQAAVLLKNVKISKDNYVLHTMEMELQADACSARLIYNAFPSGTEMSASTKAFLNSLKAAPSTPTAPAAVPEFPSVMQEFVSLPEKRHPTSAERTDHLSKVQISLVASVK